MAKVIKIVLIFMVGFSVGYLFFGGAFFKEKLDNTELTTQINILKQSNRELTEKLIMCNSNFESEPEVGPKQ